MTKLINGPETCQGQGFNIISILIGFRQRYCLRQRLNVIFITWNQQPKAKAKVGRPNLPAGRQGPKTENSIINKE